MSDPLRTDSSRATDAASEAERDAKIEQLLLAGLDHYFAGQYDQAINVWTRVLFLDRTHAPARAYIERARSAVAERQRQSEELLSNGVDAFQRGESSEARRLLQAAIAGGAPADEALAVLDRLNRLDQGSTPQVTPPVTRARQVAGPSSAAVPVRSSGRLALSIGALLFVVAAALAAAAWDVVDWRGLAGPAPVPIAAPPVVRDSGPPLPRRGEIALARARSLAAGGRLRDAIAALDDVRPTDAQRADADRLRGDLQRRLIAASVVTTAEVRARGEGRLP
jgi:hypothetical protein